MNVLLLLGGSSDNFREAGYPYPKSLVEIAGKPLIQHVIQTLDGLRKPDRKLIVAVRRDENMKYHIGSVIRFLDDSATIIEIPDQTSGAACSALLAVDLINSDEALIIVNGDQIIDDDVAAHIQKFENAELDGGIITFNGIHPRWSFVKVDADEMVIETAEKRPISNLATAGFYYFRTGRDFVEAAQAMILKDASVNGLFYVCPVYNELILRGRRIGISRIEKDQYLSFATPQGVQVFEELLRSRKKPL